MKENKEEAKLQSEQKTLQQCKEEVARDCGFQDWEHIVESYNPKKLVDLTDEVAELYASQFKSQLPIEQKNELELIIAEKNIDIIHLRDRIKELESQPLPIEGVDREWISVEERLPEPCDKVTVALSDGCVLVGRLYSNGWSAFFMDGEQSVIERQVTHWQPLPSPPKNG